MIRQMLKLAVEAAKIELARLRAAPLAGTGDP